MILMMTSRYYDDIHDIQIHDDIHEIQIHDDTHEIQIHDDIHDDIQIYIEYVTSP